MFLPLSLQGCIYEDYSCCRTITPLILNRGEGDSFLVAHKTEVVYITYLMIFLLLH